MKGLTLCKELNLHVDMLEMDSKLLHGYICNKSGWPWNIHYYMLECLDICSNFSLSLVYRECNQVADSLAKTQSNNSYWNAGALPVLARKHFNQDLMGLHYFRPP